MTKDEIIDKIKSINQAGFKPFIRLNDGVVYNISVKAIRNLRVSNDSMSFRYSEKGIRKTFEASLDIITDVVAGD